MKISYIANANLPTEKAHGIQIMSMCRAFAKNGNDVEIVTPKKKNILSLSPFAYYGTEENFRIRKIFTLDLTALGARGKIPYFIERLVFALSVLFDAYKNTAGLFYIRDQFSFILLSNAGFPVAFEIHAVSKYHFLYTRAFRKTRAIVAITQSIKDELVKEGFPEDKILVAPDGVDVEKFDNPGEEKINEWRRKLNIKEKTVAVYTGQLSAWKGFPSILEASRGLEEVRILVAGGNEKDISRINGQIEREHLPITLTGHVRHDDIPALLGISDMVLVPNSEKNRMSRYTSPLKIFEAMAAGKAIIASDIPAIREVLNGDNSYLVPPDNPEKLREAISALGNNPGLRKTLGENARKLSPRYAWISRASDIIDFIQKQK